MTHETVTQTIECIDCAYPVFTFTHEDTPAAHHHAEHVLKFGRWARCEFCTADLLDRATSSANDHEPTYPCEDCGETGPCLSTCRADYTPPF